MLEKIRRLSTTKTATAPAQATSTTSKPTPEPTQPTLPLQAPVEAASDPAGIITCSGCFQPERCRLHDTAPGWMDAPRTCADHLPPDINRVPEAPAGVPADVPAGVNACSCGTSRCYGTGTTTEIRALCQRPRRDTPGPIRTMARLPGETHQYVERFYRDDPDFVSAPANADDTPLGLRRVGKTPGGLLIVEDGEGKQYTMSEPLFEAESAAAARRKQGVDRDGKGPSEYVRIDF